MEKYSLIEVDGLKTHFQTERGRVTAVDGVSFKVEEGEILGLVGESGCGKSVTSQSILRLLDETSVVFEGEVRFKGKNLFDLPQKKMEDVRGNDISMVFQDPLSSLNPVLSIGNQIMESILLHQKVSKKVAREKALEMLRLVGIPAPEQRFHEYPHQLSGGMRQRVMIAITLVCSPKLLIADEPTTALDVTIQAQILDLFRKLNKEFKMGMIFITHDLGVVAQLCTRVVVMYLGQVVEEATVQTLFRTPKHPYTKGLIKSIPHMEGDRSKKLHVIKGVVPSLKEKPKGCRFAPRCPYADDLCKNKLPNLEDVDSSQKVRCWHVEKVQEKGLATFQ